MADNYIKRPNDVLDAEFDLRDFVASVAAQGVAPGDVAFKLRNEPGISVTSEMPEVGLIKMRVSGGLVGRVYQIGVEASTADGDSMVEMSRVRVRDPSLFDALPPAPNEGGPGSYMTEDYVEDDYVS